MTIQLYVVEKTGGPSENHRLTPSDWQLSQTSQTFLGEIFVDKYNLSQKRLPRCNLLEVAEKQTLNRQQQFQTFILIKIMEKTALGSGKCFLSPLTNVLFVTSKQ